MKANKLKLADIKKEHKYLKEILVKKVNINTHIKKEIAVLKKINLKLWNIEDRKRKAERNKNFGKSFISLARNVYIFNDRRAQIKLNINMITNSEIVEVKSYDKY